MTTSRRIFVLAAALPLWIVMILTGGQWCVMPAGADVAVASSVAGMARSGATDGAGHHQHGSEHERGAEGDTRDVVNAQANSDGTTPPSSHHGSEGKACTSQAACSAAIAPASLQLTRVPPGISGRVIAAFEKRPASLTLAPELPPPRA